VNARVIYGALNCVVGNISCPQPSHTERIMHLPRKRPGSIPESEVTPESVFMNRRRFLRNVGIGVAGAAAGGALLRAATGGFPSTRNPAFNGDGLELTPFELVTSYNNFYEFGTDKESPKTQANKGWKTEPWTLEVAGLVAKPMKIDVNDLIERAGGIEERVYRLRCVEAWSMVVPWSGFELSKLIALVEPKSDAKFVKFVTFHDPKNVPGQRGGGIDWPYVEGLTIEEARNPLTLLATGLYGKPMPNQNGAPIRLIVPWKYGFKSIKSIVRIEFVSKMPMNTWRDLQPSEYGFYANVNPKVDHPRWSQASERVIGGGIFEGRKETLMFNGYEAEVAHLYKDLDLRKWY
jgi:sulfoxide reductase catalytic subunit YedY